MTMTSRERLLAILDGRSPDRIPWIPRLNLWYNARAAEGTMPARFRGMSLREVERSLRLADPARGVRVFRIRREGVEVVTERKGNEARTSYRTPVGTLTQVNRLTSDLEGYTGGGLAVKKLLEDEADLAVMAHIAEHTYYDPCYEDYVAFDEQVGDDGLPMVFAGDVPLHAFA